MPTVADRTAATTHPLRSAGATDANDASPHSGAALRHRRGDPSSSKKPTPQPSAFIRPCFCRRGEYDCTRRPYGGSSTSDATDTGCAEPAEVPAHQASQASRTPEKICRRIGWSQLRKLGRRMLGGHRPRPAAQHPVVAVEERLRVLLVDHRREARPRPQRRRRPLPHVAEHLLGAVGRRARRVGADRRGPQRVAAEIGQRGGGFGCAPGESASGAGWRDPTRRPSPIPPRWAVGRPPTPRTPRPRST